MSENARHVAEDISAAFCSDIVTGTAPGISLADLVEVALDEFAEVAVNTHRLAAAARADDASPALLSIVRDYLQQHAICGEEESGQGCPCLTCEAARKLIEGLA